MQKYHSRGAPHERTREPGGPRPDKRFGRQHTASAPQPPLASALRLKNIRQLSAVAGEENLAVALDMPVQRVRELLEGLNFTDETAFHLETTLGLRSGFLDQVNPQLSEEDLARLKDPFAEERFEPPAATAATVPMTSDETPSPMAPEALEMPSQPVPAEAAPGEAPSALPEPSPTPDLEVQKETPVAQARAEAAPHVTTKAPPKLTNIEKLREVRRLNLGVLTTQPGAKSKLAKLTDLTPAGISHRLHGHQYFDDDSVELFSSRLGLPAGWFDVPRSESDVPEQALSLLGRPGANGSGKPRGRTPSEGTGRPRGRPRGSTNKKAADAASPQAGLDMPTQTDAAPALRSATLNRAADEPATVEAAAPAPRARAARGRPAAASAPAAMPHQAAPRQESLLAHADAEEVGPVADALLKTLALKARQGRLTEEHALKLLTSAMAL